MGLWYGHGLWIRWRLVCWRMLPFEEDMGKHVPGKGWDLRLGHGWIHGDEHDGLWYGWYGLWHGIWHGIWYGIWWLWHGLGHGLWWHGIWHGNGHGHGQYAVAREVQTSLHLQEGNSYDDRIYCFARSEYSQSMCLAGDYDGEKPVNVDEFGSEYEYSGYGSGYGYGMGGSGSGYGMGSGSEMEPMAEPNA